MKLFLILSLLLLPFSFLGQDKTDSKKGLKDGVTQHWVPKSYDEYYYSAHTDQYELIANLELEYDDYFMTKRIVSIEGTVYSHEEWSKWENGEMESIIKHNPTENGTKSINYYSIEGPYWHIREDYNWNPQTQNWEYEGKDSTVYDIENGVVQGYRIFDIGATTYLEEEKKLVQENDSIWYEEWTQFSPDTILYFERTHVEVDADGRILAEYDYQEFGIRKDVFSDFEPVSEVDGTKFGEKPRTVVSWYSEGGSDFVRTLKYMDFINENKYEYHSYYWENEQWEERTRRIKLLNPYSKVIMSTKHIQNGDVRLDTIFQIVDAENRVLEEEYVRIHDGEIDRDEKRVYHNHVSSTPEQNQIAPLVIYPNPVTDFIQFNRIPGPFEVFDGNGKACFRSNGHLGRVDAGDLAPGVYSIVFENQQESVRIVVE